MGYFKSVAEIKSSFRRTGASTSQRDANREVSGLWSDAYSRSSRSGDIHQSESNPPRRGQHDLHFRDGPRRVPTEETSLTTSQQPRLVLAPRQEDLSMSLSDVLTIRPTTAGHKYRRTFSRLLPCPCFTDNGSDSDENDAQSGRLWGPSRRPSRERRQEIAIPDYVHRIIEYTHFLIPKVDKIYAACYYWGRMDRYKAETLLEGKPEGSFLLRDSAQSEYLFSVSFRRFQRTLHARIEQGRNHFSFDILDESVFSATNVIDLIENYKDPAKCMFYEPQLSNPVSRNSVFSLQELCRAKIASKTSYGGVSSLSLPSQLKSYIRELHYSVPVRTLLTTHE